MKIINKNTILIAIILLIVIIIAIIYLLNFSKEKIKWGVTFSPYYTKQELEINWHETYLAILDDLKVDNIRLVAYWNQIEKEQGQFNFEDLDWQIEEAGKREVNIILAIGRRLPRWPECHDPYWINNLNEESISRYQLIFFTNLVDRYRDNPNISTWQIENEPYLSTFGICPPLNQATFQKEIEIVKKNSNKPILITDSGELSSWIPASRSGGDILGTTMYRVVHNKYFGYWRWPLPASFYTLKGWLVKKLTNTDKIIIAELQAEAWHTDKNDLKTITQKEIDQSMSLKQFKRNIKFAPTTGFDEIYLWGVEWWYQMKEKNNNDSYWEEAKKLWN